MKIAIARETVQRRAEAALDVLLAQARADRAFLDDFHRRRERARADQQREVGGFLHREVAGDLELVAELALDAGDRDRLALAFLVQHDRHQLADVVARDRAHRAAAGLVQPHRNRRPLRLAVERGRGIVELVAGHDHVALQRHRRHRAVGLALGHGQRTAAARGHRLLVDHADLERRGAAEDLLGARHVLHAGQLHDDAVGALLLDHRLGDAEFVDPVVQRGDVLLQRAVLDLLLRGGRQRGEERE